MPRTACAISSRVQHQGVTYSDFVKNPFWRCRTFERIMTRRPGNDQRTGRYGFCQREHWFFPSPTKCSGCTKFSVRQGRQSVFGVRNIPRSRWAKRCTMLRHRSGEEEMMPTFRTEDGAELYYNVEGTERGNPPLIFIHGWCSNLTH